MSRYSSRNVPFQPSIVKDYQLPTGITVTLEVENSERQFARKLTVRRPYNGLAINPATEEIVEGHLGKGFAEFYFVEAFGKRFCWLSSYWNGVWPVEQLFVLDLTLVPEEP
jgi:hypothetical protein